MLRFLSLLLGTLLLTGLAQAATINFNGGSVGGCTRGGTTYTCGTSFMGANDTASIASGYTVIVNGSFQLGWGQGVKMSGTARLETTSGGNIILTGANPDNISITGGTIKAAGNFVIGGSVKNITADLIAATISNTGEAATVRGSLTATGNISLATSTTITGSVSGAAVTTGSSNIIGGTLTATGAINLGSSTSVTGAVSGPSIITGSNSTLGGALTITNNIQLGSSSKVSGAVNGASITADADVALGSTLTIGGAINLASRVVVAGAVSGDTITTNSDVRLQSTLAIKGAINLSSGNVITGAVTGASIKTNSNTTLNSSLKVDGLAELGSAITVVGGVRAAEVTTISPVKNISGGITADKSITIASGSTVSGDLNAPTITLDSASSNITGNINASTLLTLGSSSRVTGNIVAPRVITKDSVTINGNAAVGYIYLDGNSTVSKVITCTGSTPGPGQAPCTCVERPSWYNYNPTCAAAPASAPDHFQITHGGSALTCQPQTVTVTACANDACTAPHYASPTTVTLQPGGKSFTFTGSTSGATVAQSTVGVTELSAPNAGAPVSCVNTSDSKAAKQCAMSFEDTGLAVTVADHIAMNNGNVMIQALAASGNKQSCVPLVEDQTVDIALSCTFVNPEPGIANGDARLTVQDAALRCGDANATAVKVPLYFSKGDGMARTTLTYSEVGRVSLKARYAGGASYSARGAGNFVAAPARFAIAATTATGKAVVAAGTEVKADSKVFAKAGEAFTLAISAVNAKGEVTTNFGLEFGPGDKKDNENLLVGTPVVNNPDGAPNEGTITRGDMAAIDKGVSISKAGSTGAWSFSEVGIIRVNVGLASGAGYLGVNRDDFKTTGTQQVGRFVPDHFDTALPAVAAANAVLAPGQVAPSQVTGMTMPCKPGGANGTALLSPCDTAFIYAYQPFYVVVKAYNSANVLLKNYKGPLARPITVAAVTAQGGATAAGKLAGGKTGSTDAPVFAFDQGVGMPAADNLPMFAATALPSATTGVNPTQFRVRATDTDTVTSERSGAVEQLLTAVAGRLLVPNVDGSPSSSMPITVQAQFYDSTRGGFVFNPVYRAVASSLSGYPRYDHCQKGLASDAATFACTGAAQLQLLAPVETAFQYGKASFRLAPPAGQSLNGSVNLTLQKACTPAPGCNAAAQWIYYLPSTTGKLTFGVYRSGPVIYTREVY